MAETLLNLRDIHPAHDGEGSIQRVIENREFFLARYKSPRPDQGCILRDVGTDVGADSMALICSDGTMQRSM